MVGAISWAFQCLPGRCFNARNLLTRLARMLTSLINFRNVISKLMKRGKQYYFNKYFENNLTIIKNIWDGIHYVISTSPSSLHTPTVISFQNETIDNPKRIVNLFNKCFNTITKKIQAIISKIYENYTD